MTVQRIKYFSYKEVEAVLISHGEITNSDYSESCTGNFEYIVDGKKYETSFSISHYNCREGYKRTIYYDVNNPQNSSTDKSGVVLLIIVLLDVIVISGLFVSIRNLFKPSDNNEKNSIDGDSDIKKRKMFNHSTYGNYEIRYDSSDTNNETKRLEMSFKDDKDYSNNELYIYFPEKIVNTLFDTDRFNVVLDNYSKIDSNYIETIIKKFIDQEIDKLSNWYDISNSLDGKKLLNDRKNVLLEGLEIDNNLKITKLYFSYNYADNDVVTFLFNYDINTRKIELYDIAS